MEMKGLEIEPSGSEAGNAVVDKASANRNGEELVVILLPASL